MARPEKLDGVLGRLFTHCLTQTKGLLSARVIPTGSSHPVGCGNAEKIRMRLGQNLISGLISFSLIVSSSLF